jgi:hypothetical protein
LNSNTKSLVTQIGLRVELVSNIVDTLSNKKVLAQSSPIIFEQREKQRHYLLQSIKGVK